MNAKTAGGLFLLQDLLYRRRNALGLSLGRFFITQKSGGEEREKTRRLWGASKGPGKRITTNIVHCKAINKKG